MAKFLVTWVIDIEDEDSHVDAARKAFEIMQRPGTTANVFDVQEKLGDTLIGEVKRVDLEEEDLEVSGE